jgi:tetratricopeptide (TPR) repeat protein
MRLLLLSFAFLTMVSCGEAGRNQKKKHLLHKGNIATKEKLYDQAIRYYNEALEIDPKFAQAYNNLGIVYWKAGEYKRAQDALNKALNSDPDFVDAYFNRSNVLIELGNYQQSLKDLKSIENVYRPEEAIHFSKGLAFFGLKEYDSAAISFEKALRQDSTNVENYVNLATARLYQNDHEASQALAAHAIEMDPSSVDALNVLGMNQLETEDYIAALENFNRGLELQYNHEYLLNNRGFVYLKLIEPEKALADINESIVINPENPWAYRNKGLYYFMQDDYENAERLFLHTIRMDGSIKLSHLYLGKIYVQQGKISTACEHFKRAIELGDDGVTEAYNENCR